MKLYQTTIEEYQTIIEKYKNDDNTIACPMDIDDDILLTTNINKAIDNHKKIVDKYADKSVYYVSDVQTRTGNIHEFELTTYITWVLPDGSITKFIITTIAKNID